MKALTAALLAVALVPAAADARRKPVKALATVSSCGVDSANVRVSVRPARRGASRRARRTSLRGAHLLLRFQLMPLFGFPRTHPAVDAGKTTSLVREESFARLPANSWTGVVRWRFKRGRKTLASGIAHTERRKVGGQRGQAFCTLPVGVPPKDVRPPIVGLVPSGAGWHRGPLEARLIAFDDLSGVAAVNYRIDGGPIRTGRSFTLVHQGQHLIEFRAKDVAGNVSPVGRVALRVDTAPPSAPTLDRPFSVTADSTPDVRWAAATDSGSGVQRYLVSVRDSAGRTVYTRQVGATGDSLQSASVGPLGNGSYTAQVFAVDGSQPSPFIRGSATRAFRVDTAAPHVTSTNPAGDPVGNTVLAFSRRNDNVTVTFDRPMSASSVNAGSLKLTRSSSSPVIAVSCSSPCTTGTINPSSSMEGLYTISASSAIRAEDGTPLRSFSSKFRVPAYEDNVESGCGFTTPAGVNQWSCGNFRGELTGSELGAPNPTRGCLLDIDRTSTATSPARTYTAGAGELLRISFNRFFSTTNLGAEADYGAIEYRIDGGSLTEIRRYPGSSGLANQVDINPPDGSHTIELRFTLFISSRSTGTNCDNPAGPGFFVDDLRVVRAP